MGSFSKAIGSSETDPRNIMILVEWASQESFDAFRCDDSLEALHHLRESGTSDYIWWLFDKMPDLRQVLRR
jgi:heme-degrading monooxygenase HmoA